MPGFLFKLIPPRPDLRSTMTDDERTTMMAHVGYWTKFAEDGVAVAFGPVDDPAGTYGIGIILADDLSAAEALCAADPTMTSGLGFRMEVLPMVSLVTPNGRHAAAG